MGHSRLHYPVRAAALCAAVLYFAQFSAAAPTIETGTSVSSAPGPIPNISPDRPHTSTDKEGAESTRDNVLKRNLDIAPIQTGVAPADTQGEDATHAPLSKRQVPGLNLAAIAQSQPAANGRDYNWVWPTGIPAAPIFSPAAAGNGIPQAQAQAFNSQLQQPGALGGAAVDGPVLNGLLTGPLEGGAQQPEDVVGLNSAPAQADIALDGLLRPLNNGAIQPLAVIPQNDQPFENQIPQLVEEPIILAGDLSGSLQGSAQQPPANIQPVLDNQFQPNGAVQPNEPLTVLAGDLSGPLQNGAQQPVEVIPQSAAEVNPVLNGLLTGPLENNAIQPPAVIPQADAAPASGSPVLSEASIINQLGQMEPARVLHGTDDNSIHTILGASEIWSDLVDNPNVEAFLLDNSPEVLQPFLVPDTVAKLKQDPTQARNLVPGLHAIPDQVISFTNFLDGIPALDWPTVVNQGPQIADLAASHPEEVRQVVNQAERLQAQQANDQPLDNTILEDETIYNSMIDDSFVSFPDTQALPGQDQFIPNGFQGQFLPNGFQGQSVPDGLQGQFIPNGFQNQPFLGESQDEFVPDDSQSPFIPNGFRQDPGSPPPQDTFNTVQPGEPPVVTSFVLPDGTMISFNCLPVYTVNGVQYPATGAHTQALSAMLANGAPSGDILYAPPLPLGGLDTLTTHSATKQLENGWTMQATDTDGVDGVDHQRISKDGVDIAFTISDPSGIPANTILGSNSVGDALGAAFQMPNANIAIEQSNNANSFGTQR
ncbi:hypothetical protein DRE_04007 [Drechslerella stenobrocha 248]|uniref:FAS1 domain-containing protein n=1 Tax=Drechslerella stenobrocha 248 TaxID=1043628 RepID=W7I2X6_9PEZI|nr:hypothetical protein DRE_04007 [Drechslerella stenobrocha 248]